MCRSMCCTIILACVGSFVGNMHIQYYKGSSVNHIATYYNYFSIDQGSRISIKLHISLKEHGSNIATHHGQYRP